jgi:hypothetical protein
MDVRRCEVCGADITPALDASYEHGYRQGLEKRPAAEDDLLAYAERIADTNRALIEENERLRLRVAALEE